MTEQEAFDKWWAEECPLMCKDDPWARTTAWNAWLARGEQDAQLKEAVALAYGYLWHVNNEPGTPSQYPPERAAYEARKALRDLMTHEQRGEAINRVRELMGHNA